MDDPLIEYTALKKERDMFSKLYEGYKFSNSVIRDQRDGYKKRVSELEKEVDRLQDINDSYT